MKTSIETIPERTARLRAKWHKADGSPKVSTDLEAECKLTTEQAVAFRNRYTNQSCSGISRYDTNYISWRFRVGFRKLP